MKRLFLYICIASVGLLACNDDNSTGQSNGANVAQNTNSNQSTTDERDVWQDPYKVLDLWREILKGKTVYEFGSNDGYWTFKLAKFCDHVIAADFNQTRLDALMEEAEKLGLENKITTRLITADDPMLASGEVDIIWAVNVYSSLPDRVGFATKLYQGMKFNGQFVILDWLNKQTQHGPPFQQRLDPMTVMDEMELAGYQDVSVRTNLLPEQWVMMSQNVPKEAYENIPPEALEQQ